MIYLDLTCVTKPTLYGWACKQFPNFIIINNAELDIHTVETLGTFTTISLEQILETKFEWKRTASVWGFDVYLDIFTSQCEVQQS